MMDFNVPTIALLSAMCFWRWMRVL